MKLDTSQRGPDHPDLALVMKNLADVIAAQGQFAPALEWYDRALAIHRKSLPANFYGTGAILLVRGYCLRQMGRLQEAEQSFHDAVTILEESLGNDDGRTQAALKALADVLQIQGKTKEAAKWRERVTP